MATMMWNSPYAWPQPYAPGDWQGEQGYQAAPSQEEVYRQGPAPKPAPPPPPPDRPPQMPGGPSMYQAGAPPTPSPPPQQAPPQNTAGAASSQNTQAGGLGTGT